MYENLGQTILCHLYKNSVQNCIWQQMIHLNFSGFVACLFGTEREPAMLKLGQKSDYSLFKILFTLHVVGTCVTARNFV